MLDNRRNNGNVYIRQSLNNDIYVDSVFKLTFKIRSSFKTLMWTVLGLIKIFSVVVLVTVPFFSLQVQQM